MSWVNKMLVEDYNIVDFQLYFPLLSVVLSGYVWRICWIQTEDHLNLRVFLLRAIEAACISICLHFGNRRDVWLFA